MARRKLDRRRLPGLEKYLLRSTGQLGRDEGIGLDVHDNLLGELDRLGTIATLLEVSSESLEPPALYGIAALIRDSEERARKILELAAEGGRRRN